VVRTKFETLGVGGGGREAEDHCGGEDTQNHTLGRLYYKKNFQGS